MREKAPEIVDRYALFDALATGGMATVYLGRLMGPAGFSRTVAIKRVRADRSADGEVLAMFADEARMAGRIRHPIVAAVVDVVATPTELLLVMDYVAGASLARLLAIASTRHELVPIPVVARILRDVLLGLHAAHEATSEQGDPLEIVHRDISPQNIMVGVDGLSRVLDFGIAKAMGRLQVTREGNVKGKLPYMAPEQIEGNVSRRADIFSASVVLWETLTGARLFRGESDAETVARLLALPIPLPGELRPEVSDALTNVVMKGLARRAAGRFSTAREMAAALAEAEPVASEEAVAEWATRLASEELVERDAIVRRIEGYSIPIVERPSVRESTDRSGHSEARTALEADSESASRRFSTVRSPFLLGSVLLAVALFTISFVISRNTSIQSSSSLSGDDSPPTLDPSSAATSPSAKPPLPLEVTPEPTSTPPTPVPSGSTRPLAKAKPPERTPRAHSFPTSQLPDHL